MEQVQPAFGRIFRVKEFSKILQLTEDAFDVRYPIQVVSPGLPFIIVPLKTLDSVRNAKLNRDMLDELAKSSQAGICFLSTNIRQEEPSQCASIRRQVRSS